MKLSQSTIQQLEKELLMLSPCIGSIYELFSRDYHDPAESWMTIDPVSIRELNGDAFWEARLFQILFILEEQESDYPD